MHHGGDLRTQGKEMALLGRLDDLIAGGKCEQPGPCSRGFSDPTFFYVKWRRFAENVLACYNSYCFSCATHFSSGLLIYPKRMENANLILAHLTVNRNLTWLKCMPNNS